MKNIYFDRGCFSLFGEVGYVVLFDGKLIKLLELKFFLKFVLVDVYNYLILLYFIVYVKFEVDVVIVFLIFCFMFIFCDVKCEVFIVKYFGVVKGICICSFKRIVGFVLRINMYC